MPAQIFSTIKATNENKGQADKTTSKRAASGAKPGTKRTASTAGFDEFDDAAIDDADLVLAENDGFENIDDFDDDPGPSTSDTRKTQKTAASKNHGNPTREPRQLANGKWACNHNCKDKNSCKHLCCREGLDKKPKPSKASNSKKEAEKSPDPKQRQLNLSVSKSSRALIATQPSRAQKSVPEPKRGPPTGPEMRNLNTLHNNVQPNAQAVPLLSAANASMKKSSTSTTLPQPGQSRSKASEAARIAAQSVYSDDFGDLDNISMLDEPANDVPTQHVSPLQKPGSGLFEDDLGDMLGSFSPPRNDHAHAEMGGKRQEEHAQDSSLYDFDEDFMVAVEKSSFETLQSDHSNLHHNAMRSAGPFVETSDSSAALDLGFEEAAQNMSSTTAVGSFEKAFTAPADGASHTNTHDGGTGEERPISSDTAAKLFMEELGADLFNYIG